MKTIPEMGYSTFLISSKEGSHRGLEGVVEVRMFNNILEARFQGRLAVYCK